MHLRTLFRDALIPVFLCFGDEHCLLRSKCPDDACTENDLCADCRTHLEHHVDVLIAEAAQSDEATLATAIAAAVHERGIVEDEMIGGMRARHEDRAWIEQHAPSPTPCLGAKTCFLDEDGQPI